MKKIRLQLLLALLLPFVGQLMMAGEVSEQEALQKAQQFLQGRTFGQKNLRRTATTNTFAQGAFYVFNADGGNRFCRTLRTVRQLEPKAVVMQGPAIFDKEMDKAEEQVSKWLEMNKFVK